MTAKALPRAAKCRCGGVPIFEAEQRLQSLYDLSVKCSGCGKEIYLPLCHHQEIGYRKMRLVKKWNKDNEETKK